MAGWFIAREQRAQLLSEGSVPDPLDPKSDFLDQKYLLRCGKSICSANKSTIRDQKIFHRALPQFFVQQALCPLQLANVFTDVFTAVHHRLQRMAAHDAWRANYSCLARAASCACGHRNQTRCPPRRARPRATQRHYPVDCARAFNIPPPPQEKSGNPGRRESSLPA